MEEAGPGYRTQVQHPATDTCCIEQNLFAVEFKKKQLLNDYRGIMQVLPTKNFQTSPLS